MEDLIKFCKQFYHLIMLNLVFYLVFYFITGQNNPFEWHWAVKTIAVCIEFGIINQINKIN